MPLAVNHCGNFVNLASVLNILLINEGQDPAAPSPFARISRRVMTDVNNVLSLSAVRMKDPEWINPKIIAFDLDCTLWPFWVDTHVTPPFHKNADGTVLDARKRHVEFIPGVPDILKELHRRGIKLAAVSRTGEIAGAKSLLKLFDFEKYFSHIEIYPGCKVAHFSKIHRETNVAYEDMMFFDDEFRNIADIKKLGVFTIYCPDGIEAKVVDSSLIDFDKSRSKRS